MDRKEGVDNDCVARAIFIRSIKGNWLHTSLFDNCKNGCIRYQLYWLEINISPGKERAQNPPSLPIKMIHKLVLENLSSPPFSVTPLKIDHFTLNPIPPVCYSELLYLSQFCSYIFNIITNMVDAHINIDIIIIVYNWFTNLISYNKKIKITTGPILEIWSVWG